VTERFVFEIADEHIGNARRDAERAIATARRWEDFWFRMFVAALIWAGLATIAGTVGWSLFLLR
jgi:hypothetical protein